jgi:hypothetical protein
MQQLRKGDMTSSSPFFYVVGALYRYKGAVVFVYKVQLNRFGHHYRVGFVDALGLKDDLLILAADMPESTWKNESWERIA